MKRATVLALIALAGLPTGWFGARALTPELDRAEEGFALFMEYCLPLARHERPQVGPTLQPLKISLGPDAWFDPRSGWLLERTERECSITDVMRLLTKDERDRFAALAVEAIPPALPMLEPDVLQRPFRFDALHFWAQYPPGDKRRWGVNLVRFAAEGPDSNTTLSITAPPFAVVSP